MKVRRIIRFEFEGGHDVEFVPSLEHVGVTEVWVDGVFVEELPQGERGSEMRAHYYREVHCPELEAVMLRPAETAPVEQAAVH